MTCTTMIFAAGSEAIYSNEEIDFKLPPSTASFYFLKLSDEAKSDLHIHGTSKRRRFGASPNGSLTSPLIKVSLEQESLEKITVHGQVDPEDYIRPTPSPIAALSARLDRYRSRSPADIAQAVLCAVGLCLLDTSRELSVADRNEARAKNPPTMAAR